MRGRILAVLAALAMVLSIGAFSPASAVATRTVCANEGTTSAGSTCLSITFRKYDGSQGFYVYSIRLKCDPYIYGIQPLFGWDNPADDGHYLQVVNMDNNSLRFNLGESSNVYVSDGNGTCSRTIDVNGDYPWMNHLYIGWSFTEQRNNQRDFDYFLQMDFINAG